MELSDVRIGLYLARKKKDSAEAFLLVWGIYPFLQAYIIPADLEERPQFYDAQIVEWEFVTRVPAPKQLLTQLQLQEKT